MCVCVCVCVCACMCACVCVCVCVHMTSVQMHACVCALLTNALLVSQMVATRERQEQRKRVTGTSSTEHFFANLRDRFDNLSH